MPISVPVAIPVIVAPHATTVAALRHSRRILIVAAPSPTDPPLLDQQRMLTRWRAQAAQRDVTIVEIMGNHVGGVTDDAPFLRRHWRLPADRFTAILIGKDGHEAFRSTEPVAATVLTRTIDAMPMRRSGQR